MTTKRSDQEKSEKYARALIDAARQEGRANKDLDDLNLVGDVARTYKEILDSEDKTVSVTVTTAVPLDDDLREKVIAKAEKDLNAPVYLVERVDPSIIGGVVLEARGNRYDASVRAQLANIRKTLSSTFIGSDD